MSIVDLQFVSNYIHNEQSELDYAYIDYELLEKQKGLLTLSDNYIYFSQTTNESITPKSSYVICENIILYPLENVNSSKTKIEKLDRVSEIFSQEFFIYKDFENPEKPKESYKKQKKIISAIKQAERELKACKEFIIPESSNDINIKYALCEWTLFILSNETIDELRDQRLGVKKKKIDVLEWEYNDVLLKPTFGCPEAWQYLADYINYDYILSNGTNNITTTFSLSG